MIEAPRVGGQGGRGRQSGPRRPDLPTPGGRARRESVTTRHRLALSLRPKRTREPRTIGARTVTTRHRLALSLRLFKASDIAKERTSQPATASHCRCDPRDRSPRAAKGVTTRHRLALSLRLNAYPDVAEWYWSQPAIASHCRCDSTPTRTWPSGIGHNPPSPRTVVATLSLAALLVARPAVTTRHRLALSLRHGGNAHERRGSDASQPAIASHCRCDCQVLLTVRVFVRNVTTRHRLALSLRPSKNFCGDRPSSSQPAIASHCRCDCCPPDSAVWVQPHRPNLAAPCTNLREGR